MVARDSDTEAVHTPPDAGLVGAWMGPAALFAGVIVRIALASPGALRTSAALAGLSAVLWALGRLVLLSLLVVRLTSDKKAVRRAWSIGLVPWVLALNNVLSVVAWAVSAWLTAKILVGLGELRHDARRAVAITWAVQAAIVVAGWLAVNVWLAETVGV